MSHSPPDDPPQHTRVSQQCGLKSQVQWYLSCDNNCDWGWRRKQKQMRDRLSADVAPQSVLPPLETAEEHFLVINDGFQQLFNNCWPSLKATAFLIMPLGPLMINGLEETSSMVVNLIQYMHPQHKSPFNCSRLNYTFTLSGSDKYVHDLKVVLYFLLIWLHFVETLLILNALFKSVLWHFCI